MKKYLLLIVVTVVMSVSDACAQDPMLGEIRMFAGNFAPRGWAFCDGQLLAISSNTALFSILGTTYGGDGRTTFALPDLRGRIAMHAGNGPGLSPIRLGEMNGNEVVVGEDKVAPVDGGKTHPITGVNYIIALQGMFPSRN
jgi:microcystin-dependent protein